MRPVNFEIVQFVDLHKYYAQTVFTFWTTLVYSKEEREMRKRGSSYFTPKNEYDVHNKYSSSHF
jgi:hypothetical protein